MSMRSRFVGMAALAVLTAVPFAAWAEEDTREAIVLPDQVKEQFRAEMREDMARLDEIIAALAEGAFGEAADVADINLTLGHKMWRRMAAEGATMKEIVAAREEMRQQGMLGKGLHGIGRFMPEHFRAMGVTMHEAAEEFATNARKAAKPPTAEDYARVLENLQAMTGVCRACHETFRVP